ncbi:MAG: HD domain-containing protein [Clostridia bacterium]|nr:HD domain-containing protein [Clostridia bacterium]
MHIDINDEINIDEVLAFAKERHKGQLRSDGQEYVTHPIRVAELVAKYKPSKNAKVLQAGALLHDVLEDTYTSYRELEDRFGEIVASLVMEVTSSTFMPKLVGKQTYLAHKMRYMSSYALIIKLADRLDNISDLKGLKVEKIQKTFFDTIYMINYIETKRVLTDAQKNLVLAIRERLGYINSNYQFTSGGFVCDTDLDQD